MNKQVFEQVGITENDYRTWCKEHKKPHYRPEVKSEFFKKIQDGKLVKENGKIVSRKRG